MRESGKLLSSAEKSQAPQERDIEANVMTDRSRDSPRKCFRQVLFDEITRLGRRERCGFPFG